MRKKVYSSVIAAVCAGAVALALVFFHSHIIVFVKGDSMAPSFRSGQVLIADRHPEQIDYSDVVVFDLHYNDIDERVIKRVIALPGDTITIKGESLMINNMVYNNVHCHHDDDTSFFVGEGEVFVLGDNADVSLDSREFGPVPISSIIAVYR